MISQVYYKQNFGYGVLLNALNNSETTMVLESGHNFPLDTSVYFKVIVWRKNLYENPIDDPTSEIMTAHYSGTINQYVINRGEEDLTATNHSVGDGVAMTMTAEIFCQRVTRTVIYSNAGTFSLTLPVGIKEIKVKMWGAGAGYGNTALFHPTQNQYTWFGGGGGGGGAYCEGVIPLESLTLTIVVGLGGVYQTDGGDTYVSDGTTTIVAGGGKKGGDGSLSGPGSAGAGGTFTGTSSGINGEPGLAGTTVGGQAGEQSSWGRSGKAFLSDNEGGFPGGGANAATIGQQGGRGCVIIEY